MHSVIDEPRRSTLYNPSQDADTMLCDRVINRGWYTFKDAEMPFNTCVEPYHCGTHVGLWLQGTPPTLADGTVTRTACGKLRSGGDCCALKRTVSVRNCGRFMVYNLSPVPGCSIAYCTVGRNSSSCETGSCQGGFPKLTGLPSLSPPIVQEPDFKFICEIPYPGAANDGAVFEVTWLVDGKPIPGVPVETVTGLARRAEIFGRQLAGHTNKELSCSVKLHFTGSNVMSPPFKSSGYWVGVKYNTERVLVDSGHMKETLTLTSTVPVVCDVIGSRDCVVDFRLHTDNEHVFTNSCVVQLKPGSWNAGSHVATTSYVITTEPTWAKTSQTVTHVTTMPMPSSHAGKIWSLITVPTVQVSKTSEKAGASCSSWGDPHIKTFDTKKEYTAFGVGQYVMVRQRRGGSFRVETKTWYCGRKAACNCAVAMREGNDVITFDMCHGRYGHTVPKIAIKNPSMFTNQTRIVKDPSGNKHVVTFRSGAVVTVTTALRFLNLYVSLPASFSSDTEGLCGYFDGVEDNDLTRPDGTVNTFNRKPENFVSSWSIPKDQSLFEVAKPLPTPKDTTRHCVCNAASQSVDCSGHTKQNTHTLKVLCPGCVHMEPPIQLFSGHPDVTATTPSFSTTPTLSTTPIRSTSPSTHAQTTSKHLNPTSTIPPSTVSQPTTPLIAKDNATRTCEVALRKDPALRSCASNQMTLDYQDILDMCVMDLELTGDADMALSAVVSMMQGCGHQALVAPPSVPIGSVPEVCPVACSLHGNCVSGKCYCDIGYESSDCSVKSGVLPSIIAISGGELCDMQTENCFEPSLVGENMKDSALKCKTKEISMYEGSSYVLQEDISQATFQSTHHVTCRINTPPEGTMSAQQHYTMSLISSAGETTSYNYTVFDSMCLNCSQAHNCTVKASACYINDRCYPAGAEDKEDHTGICVPALGNTAWHPTPTTAPPATVKVFDFRHYTGATTGCGCFFDPSKSDCACCKSLGCPCGPANKDRCFDCLHQDMCSVA